MNDERKDIEWPVLAIDPGPIYSGVVQINADYRVTTAIADAHNYDILDWIYGMETGTVVCEKITSYGMKVGDSVFETVFWTGRFVQAALQQNLDFDRISRIDAKVHHCHTVKAKDPNVVQALIDRFAPDTPNKGKGNKAAPGWFYGFSSHAWQAYAAGVAWIDKQIGVGV